MRSTIRPRSKGEIRTPAHVPTLDLRAHQPLLLGLSWAGISRVDASGVLSGSAYADEHASTSHLTGDVLQDDNRFE